MYVFEGRRHTLKIYVSEMNSVCRHLAVCDAEPRQGGLVLQGKQARIVGVRRRHLQVRQRRQQRQRAQSHLPDVVHSQDLRSASHRLHHVLASLSGWVECQCCQASAASW